MGWDIQNMNICADFFGTFNVSGSKPGVVYEVNFGGNGEGQATCTCPAFKFAGRGGSCKHIDDVFKRGCFYHPQWNDGGTMEIRPSEEPFCPGLSDEKCPKCDGPTVVVKVAV